MKYIKNFEDHTGSFTNVNLNAKESYFNRKNMKYLKKYELLKYDDPKIINDPVFTVVKE